MAEHSAAVTINAPVHQVYELYTHFNDYPKFMTFVKEVTYLDDMRSHWVVDVVGKHEWDAVNEGWIPDQQVGWRSVDGLSNSGRVRFEPFGDGTCLTVDVSYEPPAGLLGQIGEALGAGGQFERRLQHDLQHFAAMVEQAPSGALDPTSSAYLFRAGSAAAAGRTTRAQEETMGLHGRDAAPSSTADTSNAPSTTSVADESLSEPGVPRIPGTSATSNPPGT